MQQKIFLVQAPKEILFLDWFCDLEIFVVDGIQTRQPELGVLLI